MADQEDIRIAIAEMKGMLSATLPQHATRLDEHDRLITNLAATQAQQGQQLASVQAVVAERETDRRTTPPWVAVASLLIAGAAAVAAIVIPIVT